MQYNQNLPSLSSKETEQNRDVHCPSFISNIAFHCSYFHQMALETVI